MPWGGPPKQKLGEIRMEQQTEGIAADIFAFQFLLCHLETEGKNVKCPYETTPPHKGGKKTLVPHTGPPHMMLQKAVLDFGDGSILRLIHDDWLATKALQIAAPALMVRGPFIHFTP